MALPNDARLPVKRLQLRDTGTGPKLVEKANTPLFIKGPIPLSWVGAAARLSGKTLHVALAILWVAGMSGGKPFKLTRKSLELFHLSSDAAQDGVRRLEAAGLVEVSSRPGQRPTIQVRKA